MAQSRVKLTIENFGPIVEGTVEFKPLTFLIGPNNSGKTYVATLLYALSQAIGRQALLTQDRHSNGISAYTVYLSDNLVRSHKGLPPLPLPQELNSLVSERLALYREHTSSQLEDEIRRCFSVNSLSGLARMTSSGGGALQVESMTGNAAIPFVHIKASKASSSPQQTSQLLYQIDMPAVNHVEGSLQDHSVDSSADALFDWARILLPEGFEHPNSYYLPAARSGILASWPLLASLAVRSVSRALGRQQIEIPPLAGVVGDFLQVIVERFLPSDGSRDLDVRADLQPVLDLLEAKLLRGRVEIEESGPSSAQLYFTAEKERIPLQRASSMIGELAPVDLWVRELLEPNDLLIIDEPESHLHPENQRLIARVLVRLAHAGVDVVAPTHSSTILHQVSNMLLASTLNEATRTNLGFSDADLILTDDVAVYLFEPREDGVYIVPVPIEPGFGISEDEFVRVAEAIGDETFELSVATADQSA